jgi:hypothetical protein
MKSELLTGIKNKILDTSNSVPWLRNLITCYVHNSLLNKLHPQRIYRIGPRPLINPQAGFILLFSPKSACSSAVIWFFHTLGLLEAARAYNEWPHFYRTEIFNNRSENLKATKIHPQRFKILRIVRDPIDRAVSTFRHALATGYADPLIFKILDINVAKTGLSFEQFIYFLENQDLATCDEHHGLQTHPLERILEADFTINVTSQNLFEQLNRFEALMKMPLTDFNTLGWIHELQGRRTVEVTDNSINQYNVPLTRNLAQQGPWPRNLLCDDAKKRLSRRYAEDIKRYGTRYECH